MLFRFKISLSSLFLIRNFAIIMIEKKIVFWKKTVLISVVTKAQNEEQSKEYLDELAFLTYTAGGEVVKRFTQKMDMPNPKTFIGSGKMKDLEEL